MTDRDWTYDKGAWVARNQNTPMPGHGSSEVDNRTRYEIKRRLMDSDSDEGLYYLQYTEGGSVKNQLYTETVLRLNFEAVEPPEGEE